MHLRETIYSLLIYLPTENWVSVVTSQEQNTGEATRRLAKTASALCHVGSHILVTTCGPGEAEPLSSLIAGTGQGWEWNPGGLNPPRKPPWLPGQDPANKSSEDKTLSSVVRGNL